MSPGERSPDLDEQSPLIAAQDTGQDVDVEREPGSHKETSKIQGQVLQSKSTFYLILLTLSIGGLQIVWSVELSNGSPYLISLGMSKALVAFVWLAGPLTGVLVQPYIGIVSDRSKISWGKRKPFMIAGAAGTVISSLLLAYAKDIVRVIGRWSPEDKYEGMWMGITIALATILMWCLDFAINTVQAAIRAFIVDNAPAHQQDSANAWASRMTGIGNILGYVFGYLNLPEYFHFFGNTQFKILCTFASIAISSTVLISGLAIKERNPQLDPPSRSDSEARGLISFFKQTFASIKRLSPTVRSVCEIQFFHWIGWFPFLFYITTYIGQLYVNPRLKPDMSEEEIDALWARATRIGTLALLIEAIVCLGSNLLLPFVVNPTFKTSTAEELDPSSYHETRGSFIEHYLSKLHIPGLTLKKLWFCAQLLHALCMFSTFFISTPTVGIVMVAIVGISWALTLWAPFALISADVARRDEERRLRMGSRSNTTSHTARHEHSASDDPDAVEGLTSFALDADNDDESTVWNSPIDEDRNGDNIDLEDGKSSARTSPDRSKNAGGGDDEEESDRAGIILGLHNVAVSAPQILATLMCSLIFKILQKDRSEPGDESVAWALRVSGVAALVAAWFTWRMKEPGQ